MMTRALLPSLFAAAAGFSCSPTFRIGSDGGTANFDLSPLMRPGQQSYNFHDADNQVLRNFTYVLNVCGLAKKPSRSCINGTAPAYQTSARGECVALGDSVENSVWSLLDAEDPTKGVALTYFNGTYCSAFNKQRSIKIRFVCENRMKIPATTVNEKECQYTVTMATEFGCPTECARPGAQVCGSNGFCGYDTDKKAPGCFCDYGWGGESCTSSSGSQGTSKPGCDGVCVALIFVFLLLLGLIAAGIVILMRVRKMNELNIRFAALAEDLNPDGEGDETFELQDGAGDLGDDEMLRKSDMKSRTASLNYDGAHAGASGSA